MSTTTKIIVGLLAATILIGVGFIFPAQQTYSTLQDAKPKKCYLLEIPTGANDVPCPSSYPSNIRMPGTGVNP